MTQRNEPDLVSTWTYDTCAYGKGKLCTATSSNNYTRTHTYDDKGRPSTTTTTIGGSIVYPVTTTYDPVTGRLDTTQYPGGALTTRNIYNARGYLAQVTDNGNTVFWEAKEVSATGRILKEKLGNGLANNRSYDVLGRVTAIKAGVSDVNGAVATPDRQNLTYTYDTIGNVLMRVDSLATGGATTENFTYDTLNRLVSRSGTGPCIPPESAPETVTYNAIGNIANKTGVGTYVYGGPRPHAVTSITGGPMNGATYTYDANGNLTQSVDASGTRVIAFNSFNMVTSVTRTASNASAWFGYGPEHQRVSS